MTHGRRELRARHHDFAGANQCGFASLVEVGPHEAGLVFAIQIGCNIYVGNGRSRGLAGVYGNAVMPVRSRPSLIRLPRAA